MKKSVLLHACCGPCAEYPLQSLLNDDFDIKVYYYNPNIHPAAEWQRRLEQLQILTKRLQLDLIVEGMSDPIKWLKWDEQGKPDRCLMCYETRLEKTAAKACELGMDAYLSTLQVSPYQNFEIITETGKKFGKKYNVEYLPIDFRSGFRQGQNMAREDDMYRQKYCGCSISLSNSDFREKIMRDLEGLEAQSK